MPHLTAVILSYNRDDFVPTCIGSILDAQHEGLQVQVILMDNGSVDRTAEVARALGERVTVHRTEKNMPIADALNRGLRAAFELETDYIVVMNDDTKWTEGSLQGLVAANEANPYSFITPLQLNYRAPEHLDANALGDVLRTPALVEDAVLDRPLKDTYPLHTIIGAAMIATKETWMNVGVFDELFWFYGIDDDVCTRAKWLGYDILIAPNSHLLHAHGKLGTIPAQATFKKPFEKWRMELQARYVFILKDPEVSTPRAYLNCAWYMLQMTWECVYKLWPKGILHCPLVYLDCVKKYGQFDAARRRDFDPGKRVARG